MSQNEKIQQFLASYESIQLENFADSLFEESQLSEDQIFWLEECESTNHFVKQALVKNLHKPLVCISDTQTNGQGQQGNTWHSPEGNLHFSMYLPIEKHLSQGQNLTHIDGRLSLEMAVALLGIQMLQPLRLHSRYKAGIKWPNDLCVLPRNSKKNLTGLSKFGGILIEPVSVKPKRIEGEDITLASLPRVCGVVIGIGLNANNTEVDNVDGRLIQNLQELLGHQVNLAELAAQVCQACQKALDSFFGHGSSLPIRYFAYDLLYDKSIRIDQFGDMLEGVATGINQDGALTLMESLEKSVSIHTGKIQLV